MPEGPEVRKITDGLKTFFEGTYLRKIDITGGRYQKKMPAGLDDLQEHLKTDVLQFVDVGCKGKFIYLKLSNGWSIWNTLGMTGHWSKNREKHAAVEFHVTKHNDSNSLIEYSTLYFVDPRRFGTFSFVRGYDNLEDKLSSLGPDVLAEDLDDTVFKKRMQKAKKKQVVQALMDQHIVSGVGNYIKAEALYRAKISPTRVVSTLSDEELSCLNREIKLIVRESYACGGNTINDYVNVEGDLGSYENKLQVYNKKHDPLGNIVVREETADGRTTHWVPQIQK